MGPPLRARTVLLLVLLEGPGYGLDLIERVRARSGERIRLRQGAVYPALRRLERRGWLRSWIVNLPGIGRPRTYYELTPDGIGAALAEREMLAGLVGLPSEAEVPRETGSAMRARVQECFEVSAFALTLRRAGTAAGL